MFVVRRMSHVSVCSKFTCRLFSICYPASSAPLRLHRNEFGDIKKSEIRLEKLIDPKHHERAEEWDDAPARKPRRIKEISLPVGIPEKRLLRMKEKQEFQDSLEGKKVIIECSRREFNHVEGFKYRRGVKIPLATEFWDKNKYKDYWLRIKPTSKSSFAANFDDRLWDDYMPDILHPDVSSSLITCGFRTPTDIQIRALNAFQSTNHLFIAAETGSGKTVAYGAPLISSIIKNKAKGKTTRAIVLVVTKQLKQQAYTMLKDLAGDTSLSIARAEKGVDPGSNWDVLVGTPGLCEEWLKALEKPEEVQNIVMDEADMLLDESFADSLTEIFSILPVAHSETNMNPDSREAGARIIFCSATCPEELECLAEAVVDKEYLSYVKSEGLHRLMNNVELMFLRLREVDKMNRLLMIVDEDLRRGPNNVSMVFCKDRKTTSFVYRTLLEKSLPVALFSATGASDGNARILVATDMGSRGVTLPELRHVINYDMPRHTVDFLHRAGRVGRLSSKYPGRVTSFVRTASEVRLTNAIELAARLGRPLQQLEIDISRRVRESNEEESEGS